MVLLVIFNLGIYAQEGSPGEKLKQYLEILSEYNPDIGVGSELSDEIDNLLENPVNLNSALDIEIARLFFLTDYQIKSVTSYIKEFGAIVSPYEIEYIPGFDNELARLIEPFIIIETSEKKISYRKTKVRVLSNYISKKSYSNPEAPGLPFKHLSKVIFTTGYLSAGITLEKDQGEEIISSEKRVDFFSGHISYSNRGFIKNITLGDIRVRFGQGLVTWNGYPMPVTPLTTGSMRSHASITPYTSTDENNFFRGAGITIGNRNHTLLAFLSSNRIDASIDDNSGIKSITSFYDVGLHNSYSTQQKINSVTEQSGGFNYSLNLERFHTGLSLTATSLSLPVSNDNSTEELFDFQGSKNLTGSVDYSLTLNRLYVYGEIAINQGGGLAHLEGAKIITSPKTTINLLTTRTGRGYNSFHGTSAGRETVNNFRESILINLTSEPIRRITLITGILNTRELWYGTYGKPPATSRRFDTEIRYTPSEKVTINSTFKFKLTKSDSGVERGMRINSDERYSNLRLNIVFKASDGLSFQSRIETIRGHNTGTRGYMMFNGFRYQTGLSGFTILGRVYVWSTDSFDSRIYAWEDDLLYTNSINPFYNSGSRSYIIISYAKTRNFSIRFKGGFSEMRYPTGETRLDNELKIQLRFTIE